MRNKDKMTSQNGFWICKKWMKEMVTEITNPLGDSAITRQ